jgi:anti-sigma B factor antagonist
MRGGEFGAEVRHHDGTGIIDLHGEIDLAADGPLGAAYEEAVRGDPKGIVLNFAHVDYINSTGIALIVGVLARARKEGRAVGAFGLSEHYREIFAITRLSDFIGIYQDENSAVGAAAEPAQGEQR